MHMDKIHILLLDSYFRSKTGTGMCDIINNVTKVITTVQYKQSRTVYGTVLVLTFVRTYKPCRHGRTVTVPVRTVLVEDRLIVRTGTV